jgi:hypothetical protein
LEEVGIPTIIQTAIMASHDPGEKGVYPDWAVCTADRKHVFKHRERKIVKLFERHRNAAIPTGFMKSWKRTVKTCPDKRNISVTNGTIPRDGKDSVKDGSKGKTFPKVAKFQ